MQFKEALERKRKWNEKGNPPCDHSLEREYYGSAHTGDYACTTCGETFWTREEAKKSV